MWAKYEKPKQVTIQFTPRGKDKVAIGKRIKELEALVRKAETESERQAILAHTSFQLVATPQPANHSIPVKVVIPKPTPASSPTIPRAAKHMNRSQFGPRLPDKLSKTVSPKFDGTFPGQCVTEQYIEFVSTRFIGLDGNEHFGKVASTRTRIRCVWSGRNWIDPPPPYEPTPDYPGHVPPSPKPLVIPATPTVLPRECIERPRCPAKPARRWDKERQRWVKP